MGWKYATIQARADAAGANNRLVVVPSAYAGADPSSVPTNVSILDLRRNGSSGRHRVELWDGGTASWNGIFSESGGGGYEKPLFHIGRSYASITDNSGVFMAASHLGGAVTAGKTHNVISSFLETRPNLDTDTNSAPDPANLEAFTKLRGSWAESQRDY